MQAWSVGVDTRGYATTRIAPSHRAEPDQVERQFQADAADHL